MNSLFLLKELTQFAFRLSGKGRGDLKESFYLARQASAPNQRLPETLERNRPLIEQLIKECEGVAQKLLEGFAIGLEVR